MNRPFTALKCMWCVETPQHVMSVTQRDAFAFKKKVWNRVNNVSDNTQVRNKEKCRWSESFCLWFSTWPWNGRERNSQRNSFKLVEGRRVIVWDHTGHFSAVADLSPLCVVRQKNPVPVIPFSPHLSRFLTILSPVLFHKPFLLLYSG